MAKAESNVKYGNKVEVIGQVSIEGQRQGARPSRVLPVRSIHFLKPEQVHKIANLGGGVQGEVFTCYISDCKLIPRTTILVAKIFKDEDKHKQQADTAQEMLMGGLDHKGIVGALAIIISDPPILIYDLYNGGSIGTFMDKCDEWRKEGWKAKVDHKFIGEKKLFIENRLGIALALLESLEFMHKHNQFHCDLHSGNVLLHFDYDPENGRAHKVYVALCDFGCSKSSVQCYEPNGRMWATKKANVATYLAKHPQLAPELVRPKPSRFSRATDIHAMGNLLKRILLAPDCWDGMCRTTRYLSRGWVNWLRVEKLETFIGNMMAKDPATRETCSHWIALIVTLFPECGLRPNNSYHLRD